MYCIYCIWFESLRSLISSRDMNITNFVQSSCQTKCPRHADCAGRYALILKKKLGLQGLRLQLQGSGWFLHNCDWSNERHDAWSWQDTMWTRRPKSFTGGKHCETSKLAACKWRASMCYVLLLRLKARVIAEAEAACSLMWRKDRCTWELITCSQFHATCFSVGKVLHKMEIVAGLRDSLN